MSIDPQLKQLRSWGAFVSLATNSFSASNKWLFRGGLDHWRLQPSLERAAADWGIALNDLPEIERRLLRDFKRAYTARVDMPAPSQDADLAWLALMQHHGAPTRLLDWTYSPFVAAFFAMEALLASPKREKRWAAIWALSGKPVSNKAIRALLRGATAKKLFDKYSRQRDGAAFRKLFLRRRPRLAFATPVNPYKLPQRLVLQQGLFLCPGNISLSFEDNLSAVPKVTDHSNIMKILLPRSALSDAFASLRRMNISRATLFPGIDGYASNLRNLLDFLHRVALYPDTAY